MRLSAEVFNKLESHWVLDVLGCETLKRAADIANERLVEQAVGQQISFDFQLTAQDMDLLERVAFAYELAAVEGVSELSRPAGEDDSLRMQAAAASFCAFGLRRVLPVPKCTHERLWHVLQLSALAYCGDRWFDMRRWYSENAEASAVPCVADAPWDQRILYRLFDCWIRLFRKNGWDDLNRIREIIAGLREDQKTMEEHRLRNESPEMDRAVAFRLIALYHWARATEVLAVYMMQGQPVQPFGHIEKHYEAAIQAATASGDSQHEMILRWLYASSQLMIRNSLWWTTRRINSRTSDFVKTIVERGSRSMFELLPPQRAALVEHGLLDQAKTAIVVDLPTSGGKTLLAQFRMLQALNQFDADQGWVAYVAPTRALSAQITRTLRRDFSPIGIRIEQLTAAVEVDAFEDELLNDTETPFHVLVATPEKLSLVIRNKKIKRPLALIVMDEAHNIEDESRGMRIEFLLATIKRESPQANFLLLMPYVERPESVSRWLAHDVDAGQAVSLCTSPWKPNERIVGLYRAVADDSERAGWHLEFETLTTTEKAMPLRGTHRVGTVRPINVPKSSVLSGEKQQKGLGLQTAAIGTVLSGRGTSISVANDIRTVWNMATKAAEVLPSSDDVSSDIRLVQNFLRTEIASDFRLIDMLESGVGVHHAGLSDDVRTLMEWLAETGRLKLLCATSTIAQGINFPVASVFLASRFVPGKGFSTQMSPREFWNLAGRAGRLTHDSVGVVGLAEGNDRNAAIEFVGRNTGELVSRLVTLLEELATTGCVTAGGVENLSAVLWKDEWEDFRCYIAHLWAEKQNLESVLADSEQLLRQTYGYTTLRNDPHHKYKAEFLLKATRDYAHELAGMNPGVISLADSTGFSPEGVSKAMQVLNRLEHKLTQSDWTPDSLFGIDSRMSDLFGVMLKIPQLKRHLEDIASKGLTHSRLSDMTLDWVNGKTLQDIASAYFSESKDPLTDACRAVYRAIVNCGTWGFSALNQIASINTDALSEADLRRVNALPAMIYHGVRSEEAVLMRMNAVPRSAAEGLGHIYRDIAGEDASRYSICKAREFLHDLTTDEWDHARPKDAALSGADYKNVWEILTGRM